MTPEAIITIIGAALAVLGIVAVVFKKLPKRLKAHHYTKKWRDLQKLCVDKETWPEAIVAADMLVDEAMKRKRVSGKTMGERMVNASESFSNKDALWSAHKLADHVEHADEPKLKETDVKDALVAFRQALRDLGAL